MTARDELEGAIWRLRGIAAFAHLLHEDDEGGLFLDDLPSSYRAAVLSVLFDLTGRVEELLDAALRELERRT